MTNPAFVECVRRDGFAIVPDVLTSADVRSLVTAVEVAYGNDATLRRGDSVYGMRDLLNRVPEAAVLATSAAVRSLVEPLLGPDAFAVRGLWFDKTSDANWNLPWHRDLTVAVKRQVETPGFRGWTMKAAVPHALAPVDVLRRMLTVRLHLDAADTDNGALLVIPGSHEVDELTCTETPARDDGARLEACCVSAGDAVLMRPLLLHSSRAARSPSHRRVIHLEFAAEPLPGGLEWHTAMSPG